MAGWIPPKNRWLDAAFFMILAGGCLLLFGQGDINVTGDRSFLFLEHGFFDFYDASHAATGGYGANYMPSTFWLFALWNTIPWLFGARPVGIGQSPHMLLTLWYKILPCLFYLGCGILVFKILKELGCGEKKARLGMYLFFTAPFAVFSQFVFSQYDSFVVFFTLLGILFYLKNKDWAFILCFGVAATFKYYALAIMIVFLFLKEKRVGRLLYKLGAGLLPLIIETLIYLPSEAFRKSVFGFRALTYTSALGLDIGIAAIQIVPFIAVLLCAWAYFVKPKTTQERFLWAVYLSMGICFVLFGLSTFHPQWLLFGVPFWVFGLVLYEKQPVFYWLDILAMAVLTVLIANVWQGNIDSIMFESGILAPFISYQPETAKTILDFLPFYDKNLLYTILSALFFLMFLCRHPRYFKGDIKAMPECGKALLRGRFAAILLFIIPLFCCLPSLMVH